MIMPRHHNKPGRMFVSLASLSALCPAADWQVAVSVSFNQA